jgi:hypothetical protein
MKSLSLNNYGPIISDKTVGNEIYSLINSSMSRHDVVSLDLSAIKSMATFNAKQIFGRLYVELGSNTFFDKIRLLNASDDLKIIIQIGIQNALEDEEEKK